MTEKVIILWPIFEISENKLNNKSQDHHFLQLIHNSLYFLLFLKVKKLNISTIYKYIITIFSVNLLLFLLKFSLVSIFKWHFDKFSAPTTRKTSRNQVKFYKEGRNPNLKTIKHQKLLLIMPSPIYVIFFCQNE